MFRVTFVRVSLSCCTIFLAAVFLSCGGSSSPQKPTLQSIAVSPNNAQLFLGTNQKFTATGKLTDGSTQDLTQTVKWSSSDPTVMLLNNSPGRLGIGNTRGPGTATVSASNGTLNGTTTVTVTRHTPAFLYAANNGTKTISAFLVDPSSGMLTPVAGSLGVNSAPLIDFER